MGLNSETIEQIKIAEWLKQCHPSIPFMHIATERKCNAVYGRILKRLGVRAGVSDLFLPKGNKTCSGLWLELKTLTGRPSPSQLEFINEMIDLGYGAFVCYGADEAIQVISNFYGLNQTSSI